ncbi:MAG: Gfo/Idh/MocA family oxidoreductase [Salinivirgaceae bacterium]|nr:Gfo/Idh/MocA family oxidoreductase [Salinivirgaceae bacterium]
MNKNFRIGIMGTGWIAEKMAITVAGLQDVELYAVASRSQERANEFAATWHFTKAYGSYEQLVNDPEVDLVYIGTPHSEHFDNMMLCLSAYKPILCEKAFTATARQAEQVINEAHKRNVFVSEAIWTRFMPLSHKIIELANSGIIGTPNQVSANLCYPNIERPRMYLPELAGGALLDLGVYCLNFAAMIFGSDIEETSSSAMMTKTGVDAANSITLKYSNNRMAVLWSSNLTKSAREGIISGENGHLIVENINNPQSVSIFNNDYQLVEKINCEPQITGYEYEVLASMEAIKNKQLVTPFMSHDETIRIMRQMDELRTAWGVVYPWD